FSIDIGTSENLVLNANGGDDSFTASNGLAGLIALSVDGGAGNDTIIGGGGNGTVSGGGGGELIRRGRGHDTNPHAGAHSNVRLEPWRRQRRRRGGRRHGHDALQRRQHRGKYQYLGQRQSRALHP